MAVQTAGELPWVRPFRELEADLAARQAPRASDVLCELHAREMRYMVQRSCSERGVLRPQYCGLAAAEAMWRLRDEAVEAEWQSAWIDEHAAEAHARALALSAASPSPADRAFIERVAWAHRQRELGTHFPCPLNTALSRAHRAAAADSFFVASSRALPPGVADAYRQHWSDRPLQHAAMNEAAVLQATAFHLSRAEFEGLAFEGPLPAELREGAPTPARFTVNFADAEKKFGDLLKQGNAYFRRLTAAQTTLVQKYNTAITGGGAESEEVDRHLTLQEALTTLVTSVRPLMPVPGRPSGSETVAETRYLQAFSAKLYELAGMDNNIDTYYWRQPSARTGIPALEKYTKWPFLWCLVPALVGDTHAQATWSKTVASELALNNNTLRDANGREISQAYVTVAKTLLERMFRPDYVMMLNAEDDTEAFLLRYMGNTYNPLALAALLEAGELKLGERAARAAPPRPPPQPVDELAVVSTGLPRQQPAAAPIGSSHPFVLAQAEGVWGWLQAGSRGVVALLRAGTARLADTSSAGRFLATVTRQSVLAGGLLLAARYATGDSDVAVYFRTITATCSALGVLGGTLLAATEGWDETTSPARKAFSVSTGVLLAGLGFALPAYIMQPARAAPVDRRRAAAESTRTPSKAETSDAARRLADLKTDSAFSMTRKRPEGEKEPAFVSMARKVGVRSATDMRLVHMQYVFAPLFSDVVATQYVALRKALLKARNEKDPAFFERHAHAFRYVPGMADATSAPAFYRLLEEDERIATILRPLNVLDGTASLSDEETRAMQGALGLCYELLPPAEWTAAQEKLVSAFRAYPRMLAEDAFNKTFETRGEAKDSDIDYVVQLYAKTYLTNGEPPAVREAEEAAVRACARTLFLGQSCTDSRVERIFALFNTSKDAEGSWFWSKWGDGDTPKETPELPSDDPLRLCIGLEAARKVRSQAPFVQSSVADGASNSTFTVIQNNAAVAVPASTFVESKTSAARLCTLTYLQLENISVVAPPPPPRGTPVPPDVMPPQAPTLAPAASVVEPSRPFFPGANATALVTTGSVLTRFLFQEERPGGDTSLGARLADADAGRLTQSWQRLFQTLIGQTMGATPVTRLVRFTPLVQWYEFGSFLVKVLLWALERYNPVSAAIVTYRRYFQPMDEAGQEFMGTLMRQAAFLDVGTSFVGDTMHGNILLIVGSGLLTTVQAALRRTLTEAARYSLGYQALNLLKPKLSADSAKNISSISWIWSPSSGFTLPQQLYLTSAYAANWSLMAISNVVVPTLLGHAHLESLFAVIAPYVSGNAIVNSLNAMLQGLLAFNAFDHIVGSLVHFLAWLPSEQGIWALAGLALVLFLTQRRFIYKKTWNITLWRLFLYSVTYSALKQAVASGILYVPITILLGLSSLSMEARGVVDSMADQLADYYMHISEHTKRITKLLPDKNDAGAGARMQAPARFGDPDAVPKVPAPFLTAPAVLAKLDPTVDGPALPRLAYAARAPLPAAASRTPADRMRLERIGAWLEQQASGAALLLDFV